MYQGKILNQQTQDHILITDLNIQNYQTLYLSVPEVILKNTEKAPPKPNVILIEEGNGILTGAVNNPPTTNMTYIEISDPSLDESV